ncbi:MAG: heparinase II/III family protein [Bacteroidetes bacterium]|nr:heparinase II/III family protein [Bacteroidota bacterium]
MFSRPVLAMFLFALLVCAVSLPAAGADGGVFFEPQKVARYRELFAKDPLFAGLRSQIDTVDRSRERSFMKSGIRYNDHLYDIARVGNLAQQMSLIYLYTGDADAAALAEECVESLMKFPRWDYFLEGGTEVIGLQRAPNSAIAVALTVEALGDRIAPEKRKTWLTTMAKRGTEPSYLATYGMRHPDRVKGWSMDSTSTYYEHRPLERGLDFSRWPIILNTINLKAIPASALALSALVYRKHMGESEDTRRWLEQAVYSVGTFRDIYARDGSYNEGISYAHYTTLHLIQAIDALRRERVADLSDMLNWTGYQNYLLEMTQATRDEPSSIVNFSDAGAAAHASVSYWIARHTRDGVAQWFGKNLAMSQDIWSILYYDASVSGTPPPQSPHLWLSDLDWIVGRTGYLPEDLVVALRSGGPFNHEHADRNGIIVKAFGEKLVVDPLRPPYGWRDPSWKMRLTGGHSSVLIDGKGHQYVDGTEGTNSSQASASIVRWGEREGYFFWTSDATPAYKLVQPDVQSITRTLITLPDLRAVVVVDKVSKISTPSTIQARFYAFNTDGKGKAEAGGEMFTMIRPGAKLDGRAASNAGIAYSAAFPDIPLERAKTYPFVEVSTTNPARDICLVSVLLPSPAGKPAGSATVVRNGDRYAVDISAGGKSAHVSVMDAGTIPEFEVTLK